MPTQEVYVTQERDVVDLIAFKRFGVHGSEPAILAANPGLAAYGPFLPAGLSITIPVPGVPTTQVLQNPWGTSE